MQRGNQRLRWACFWVALCVAELWAGQTTAAQDVDLKIIAINDFHGNLESPGSYHATPQSPAVPVGGADYLAGYIHALKQENPVHVVVSAGDLTGGSPLISALVHDEGTVDVMNHMGLELNGVGNHEFDGGLRELERKQHGGCWKMNPGDACAAGDGRVFHGANFEYLAANVYDTSTGKTIFPGYAIRTYGGVKVAFLGLTLKDTPTIVTPSGVAGLRFADEADTINAIVQRLRRKGVHTFVVLLHQGGFQKRPDPVDINGCVGGLAGSPVEAIVNRLDDGVDLVLSAHTHIPYVCEIANRAGHKVLVTSASAYGRVVTDADMTLDRKTGRAIHVAAKNVLVDRTNAAVQPDAAIHALVEAYAAQAAPLANGVVGSIARDILKPENASGESEMGEMIADAELEATHAPADGGAVIAFMNLGGVRTGLAYASGVPGIAPGKVTYGELFTAQPFGNDLVTMTLTGAQVKMVLEEQFAGCGMQEPGDSAGGEDDVPKNRRWLDVSAGFSYAWHENGAVCAKVDANSIRLNGTVVDPATRYRVTVNSLLATGGEQLPVFNQGTDRHVGVQDLEAMEMYLGKHPAVLPAKLDRVRGEP